MHTELGELLEAYECELDILSFSYDMMGQMLNKKHMEHRIELLGVSDIYIRRRISGNSIVQCNQSISKRIEYCG